ncbi:hypothetical protein TYRP_017405 [Tyrophagus putrescentiae]|nr:hypothetical protein TYRP_017405 [Tyrophagus putrescentiae]
MLEELEEEEAEDICGSINPRFVAPSPKHLSEQQQQLTSKSINRPQTRGQFALSSSAAESIAQVTQSSSKADSKKLLSNPIHCKLQRTCPATSN